jgi:hypothetical protein
MFHKTAIYTVDFGFDIQIFFSALIKMMIFPLGFQLF